MKNRFFLVLALLFSAIATGQIQNFNTQVRFKNVSEHDLQDSTRVAVLDETGLLKYVSKDSLGSGDFIPLTGTEEDKPVTGTIDMIQDENLGSIGAWGSFFQSIVDEKTIAYASIESSQVAVEEDIEIEEGVTESKIGSFFKDRIYFSYHNAGGEVESSRTSTIKVTEEELDGNESYQHLLPLKSGTIAHVEDLEDYIQEPTTDGTSGQVLTTDGSGGRSWTTVSGGGITALTGDVIASGTGSVTATIPNGTVTNAKMANMSGFSVKAKTTTGSGAPTDLAISPNSAIGRAGSGNVSSLGFGTGIVLNGTTINTFNGSYSATQQLTNGTWVDNKPVYKITYTGSNTASINVAALNIATLIDIEGTFTVTTPSSNSIVMDCNAFMLGEFDPSDYINSKAVYNATTGRLNIDLLEGDFEGLPRVVSTFTWRITLYYTKP